MPFKYKETGGGGGFFFLLNISILFQIFTTVLTATAERSSPILTRLKNDLRSTITETLIKKKKKTISDPPTPRGFNRIVYVDFGDKNRRNGRVLPISEYYIIV